MPSYLLTGDRDSLQLLSDKTSVLLLKTGQTALFTPEKFQETYGVPASHYLDVKALMGDSSDAIPGIPGVGEKTALRLIAEYGTLDRLYAAMDEAGEKGDTKKLPAISPSLFTKLIGGRESAYLSYTLAKIVRDVPVEGGLDALRRKETQTEELRRLLASLEFAGFLKRLGLTASSGERVSLPAKTAAPVAVSETSAPSAPPAEHKENTPPEAEGESAAASGAVFRTLSSEEEIEKALATLREAALAIDLDKETGEQTLWILPLDGGEKRDGLKLTLPPPDGGDTLRAFLSGKDRLPLYRVRREADPLGDPPATRRSGVHACLRSHAGGLDARPGKPA